MNEAEESSLGGRCPGTWRKRGQHRGESDQLLSVETTAGFGNGDAADKSSRLREPEHFATLSLQIYGVYRLVLFLQLGMQAVIHQGWIDGSGHGDFHLCTHVDPFCLEQARGTQSVGFAVSSLDPASEKAASSTEAELG